MIRLGVHSLAARADGEQEEPKNRRIEDRKITLRAGGTPAFGRRDECCDDPEHKRPENKRYLCFRIIASLDRANARSRQPASFHE